ncbi:hypothetical protein [Staphylococcus saprophyticus]|uniref:hypothetical protein n=1 Tax=Staphylococcus saprophyticus TaxID=29385 RepID=UPI00374E90AC
MILSDAIRQKYKLNTCGQQTHEVAKVLRNKGFSGFLISINERSVVMLVPREDVKRNRKIMEGIRNGKD